MSVAPALVRTVTRRLTPCLAEAVKLVRKLAGPVRCTLALCQVVPPLRDTCRPAAVTGDGAASCSAAGRLAARAGG